RKSALGRQGKFTAAYGDAPKSTGKQLSDGGSRATSQRVHLPFLIRRGRRRRIEETRSVQDFLPAARAEHQSLPALPKQRIRPRTTSFAYHYTPCVFARSIRARRLLAHLNGASNEPARGVAMTSGPQLTNSYGADSR